MDELVKLREMIRSAEGSSRNVDLHIAEAFGIPQPWQKTSIWPPFAINSRIEKQIPAFTSSIDAALALCERLKHDAQIRLSNEYMGWWRATVGLSTGRTSKTAPLAILDAVLTALLEKEAANEAE